MNATISVSEKQKTEADKVKETKPVTDQPSWAESAKEDLEEFIESQGIYIRQ